MNRMVYKKKQKKAHPLRKILLLILLALLAFCVYQYINFGNLDIIKQSFIMMRIYRKYAFF